MTKPNRILVGMIDGLDSRYLEQGDMPRLTTFGESGQLLDVDAVLPTVTNANNVSIACGALPRDHGITGNSYLDETTGTAEYMEDGTSILIPTVFQLGALTGRKTALLTSKVKTINLLADGADLAIAAEAPAPEIIDQFGSSPEIYSAEINEWLWRVAIELLRTRPDLDLVYVHTTDFPMHAWKPDDPRSKAHLEALDLLIEEAVSVAPDISLYLTADHGMNDKNLCWDLAVACKNRNTPVRFALSAERDRYVRHHRTFGGTAWVWLHHDDDTDTVIRTIAALDGVEAVLTRQEAADRYGLLPERIGELVVLGDPHTVFGELDGPEREELADGYRTHGSRHEQRVPLVTYNTDLVQPEHRRHNADLLLPVIQVWRTQAVERAPARAR